MRQANSLPFNYYYNTNYNMNINSPKNVKKYNLLNVNNNIKGRRFYQIQNGRSQQEIQSSLDNDINNYTNKSPDINLYKNMNFFPKGKFHKTPKRVLSKKNLIKSPILENYDFDYEYSNSTTKLNEANLNNMKIKNFTKDNELLLNDNYIYINNTIDHNSQTGKNIQKKNIIYNVKNDIKKIKNNYNFIKNEIVRLKFEYNKMQNLLIKGVEKYVKTTKNNKNKMQILEKQLIEYKTKYNDLLNNNNNINENISKYIIENRLKEIDEEKKKFEIELNNNKNKEIKELKDKYEEKMKEEIENKDIEIIQLKLDKKKLLNQINQQHIKIKDESMNSNNENNKIDLIKELEEKNNEIKVLKQKNFEYKKKLDIKNSSKNLIKINNSEENSNKENNLNEQKKDIKEILLDNKNLRSELNILKSQKNNFMKQYFKYKEIAENLITDNKQLAKERDGYKKKKAELNNEIEIIKMNNDRMNNIKIKNNILINNNLLIKNKCNNNSKEKYTKVNKEILDKTNERSKSAKYKINLNKNKTKELNTSNISNNTTNNAITINKKFLELKISNKINDINIIGIKKVINNNVEQNVKGNNSHIEEKNANGGNGYGDIQKEKEKNLEMEKKYNEIIEKLKSEIRKKDQSIAKYELEKQILEKKKKTVSDSNSYQINGLNEIIRLLKEKNQKLNVENEKLKNKSDERVIELVKELNIKQKEMSSLLHNINILKKELSNNGIDIPNLENN